MTKFKIGSIVVALHDSPAGIGHANKGHKFIIRNGNYMDCVDKCGTSWGYAGCEEDFADYRKPTILILNK